MTTFIKTHWPAIIAAALITAFIACAVLSVINLTEAHHIDWRK